MARKPGSSARKAPPAKPARPAKASGPRPAASKPPGKPEKVAAKAPTRPVEVAKKPLGKGAVKAVEAARAELPKAPAGAPAKAAKAGPKAPKKPATPRAAPRLKIVWAVCDHTLKTLKTFPYPERRAAELEASRLQKSKGKEHLVRAERVPMTAQPEARK